MVVTLACLYCRCGFAWARANVSVEEGYSCVYSLYSLVDVSAPV